MSRRTMLFPAILLSTVAIGFGCSDTRSEPDQPAARRALPIVGGAPAQVDDYPSTVALTDLDGIPICAGTLITPTVVLTAAHCLREWSGNPMSADSVRIIYGHVEPRTAPVSARLTVKSLTPHPGYDRYASADADGLAHSNDIGVAVLSNPVPNAVVTPILPPADVETTMVQPRDVHIAGFGLNDIASSDAGILFSGVTPYQRHIKWEMLAGAPGNPDSCDGDSGGPAYVVVNNTRYLVGVTSRRWVKSQHPCGDGGIYTMVPAYVDWIAGVGGELDGGDFDGSAGAGGQGGSSGAGGGGMDGGGGTADGGGSAGAGDMGGGAIDPGVDGRPSDPGPMDAAEAGGGCNCRAAGNSNNGSGAVWALALGLVLGLRRRLT